MYTRRLPVILYQVPSSVRVLLTSTDRHILFYACEYAIRSADGLLPHPRVYKSRPFRRRASPHGSASFSHLLYLLQPAFLRFPPCFLFFTMLSITFVLSSLSLLPLPFAFSNTSSTQTVACHVASSCKEPSSVPKPIPSS